MRVLGVDLSYTATGLAYIEGQLNRVLWTISTKSTHEGQYVGRAAMIGDTIRDEALARDVEIVAIEAPGFQAARSQGQPHNTGILHGIVRYLLDEANIPVLMIPPNVWRKVLFDKGNLRKEEIRTEVYKKFGLEHRSMDALEAFCVAMTAHVASLDPDTLPKYQRDAITTWRTPKEKKKR